MKLVTIASSNPAGADELAESILAIPAVPRSRWNYGNVFVAALGMFASARSIIMCDTGLSVFDAPWPAGGLTDATTASLLTEDIYTFARGEGAFKSRPLADVTAGGLQVSMDAAVIYQDGSPTNNPFLAALVKPQDPVYTLLSLIAAITDYCEASSRQFVCALDQSEGILNVALASGSSRNLYDGIIGTVPSSQLQLSLDIAPIVASADSSGVPTLWE